MLRLRFAPPTVELRAVVDTLWDETLVERVDQLVVHQDVGPARLVLELLDLPHEPAVVQEKRRACVVVALDQRLADEDLSRFGRIHRTEMHAPLSIRHQTQKRPALERGAARGWLLPMRSEFSLLDRI